MSVYVLTEWRCPIIRLHPRAWTRLPDTGLEVRYDGDRDVVIGRLPSGVWDLSRAVLGRPLWVRFTDHPHLGQWPVVPLHRRRLA